MHLRRPSCPLTPAVASVAGPGQPRRAQRLFARVAETCPELLISDENLIGGTRRAVLFGRDGRIYPDAGRRLRKLLTILPNQPAVAVLSVRDPARFVTSALSLQINLGMELELDSYLQGHDPTVVDWTGLAARILSVSGISRLIVWRYEDYRALRPRILSVLLPAGLARRVPDPKPVNVSLSQQGYDWLVGRAMQDSETDLRDLAAEARKRFSGAADRRPLNLLDAAQHRLSAEYYAQDLARLRCLPGVDFLEP